MFIKICFRQWSTVVAFCLCLPSVSAQKIIRGPYLQSPTSHSIIIRWRTDTLAHSRVVYGTKPDSLIYTKEGVVATTEHRVLLDGLSPFTKYYYAVGTSDRLLSGPDALHHFITAPVPGTAQPIRVWAIGDFGRANNGQREVRDSYLNYAGNTHTDVWLWLGDNVYSSGYDWEYQQKVFDSIYGYHHIFKYMPFWACPGNHDYEVISPIFNPTYPPTHAGPYYDIIDAPTNGEAGGVPSGYELYYSFDYGNVHFISLNSEIGALQTKANDWTGIRTDFTGSPMTAWLEQDLQANDKPWVIAFWHQPPYSKCSQVNSDDSWQLYLLAMRRNIVPILEQYGVDLVICGHSHIYSRSYMIHGHYGYSSTFDPSTMLINGSSGKMPLGEPYIKYTTGALANKGTVYVIEGNSGGDDSIAPPNHPVMYFADAGEHVYGSFILDIDGNRLDGKYLRSNTGEILDEFTIFKDSIPSGVLNVSGAKQDDMNIFPNPFHDEITVTYVLKKKGKVSFGMLDMTGKLMHSFPAKETEPGAHVFQMDITEAGLSRGVYILKMSCGRGVICRKVVKTE